MGKSVDLSGRRYERLVVVHPVEIRNHKMIWLCQCDCGNTKEVPTNHLNSGHIRSCGCLRKEVSSQMIRNYISTHESPKRKEFGFASKNHLYTAYKKGAIKKGREFSITKEQFFDLTSRNCYYCGAEPSRSTKRKDLYGEYRYNGIDRIENSIGYIHENCVPCCWQCNKAKLDRDFVEFIDWLDRIAEFRKPLGTSREG